MNSAMAQQLREQAILDLAGQPGTALCLSSHNTHGSLRIAARETSGPSA